MSYLCVFACMVTISSSYVYHCVPPCIHVTQIDEDATKELSKHIMRLESLSLKLSNPCALGRTSCAHINQLTTLRCVCSCLFKYMITLILVACDRCLVLDCVDDEGLQILCGGKLKLHFLDLSQSGITDKRYDYTCIEFYFLQGVTR